MKKSLIVTAIALLATLCANAQKAGQMTAQQLDDRQSAISDRRDPYSDASGRKEAPSSQQSSYYNNSSYSSENQSNNSYNNNYNSNSNSSSNGSGNSSESGSGLGEMKYNDYNYNSVSDRNTK